MNKVTSANPPPPRKMRMRKAGRKSLKVAVALGGVSMNEIISGNPSHVAVERWRRRVDRNWQCLYEHQQSAGV